MLLAFILTVREVLEAALLIGIFLTYLGRTGNERHVKYIWFGLLIGVVFSVIFAFVFEMFLGGFIGVSEQIYEGITRLFAFGLLTWMIVWMIWQKYNFKKNLEKKMAIKLDENKLLGLLFLAFITVAREGVEIVLFLKTLSLQVDYSFVFMGFGLGAVLAILLSYLLFKQIYRVKLTKFFTVSSVLLIFFAAGLLAGAIHELQEAHVVPVFIEHVWDINSFLNEKDSLGEFFATFFGYNANPSLLEVFAYSSYLLIIAFVWRKVEQKRVKDVVLFS